MGYFANVLEWKDQEVQPEMFDDLYVSADRIDEWPEAARQLCAYSLTLMDRGEDYTVASATAKCKAGDAAMYCTTEAVQILGGYGFSRDYPVEKLMRDAKIFQLFEGTNEIQRLVVGRSVVGKC